MALPSSKRAAATGLLALTSTTLMGCGNLFDLSPSPTPAPAPPLTKGAFCADEDNFQADGVIESLSWCDGIGSVQAQDCNSKGCRHVPTSVGGGCECGTKTRCETIGGTWTEVKCKELGNIGTLITVAEEANGTGGTNPCEGKRVEFREFVSGWGWDLFTMDLREAVGHVGRECCSDFPSTLCDSDTRATTCAIESDFKPDKDDVHGECNTHLTVEKTKWLAAGCTERSLLKEWYGDFECETKTACEAAGSRWMRQTCADWLRLQEDDYYRQIAKAHERQDCTDLKVDEVSSLDYWYTRINRKCCKDESDICDVGGGSGQYLI